MLTHSLDIKLQSSTYRLWPNLGLWARRGYKILFLTPPRQNLHHCLTCTVDKKYDKVVALLGSKANFFLKCCLQRLKVIIVTVV